MVNPVATLGQAVARTEIRFDWAKKLWSEANQKWNELMDSEAFWMTASVTLLLSIDWATQHALLSLTHLY